MTFITSNIRPYEAKAHIHSLNGQMDTVTVSGKRGKRRKLRKENNMPKTIYSVFIELIDMNEDFIDSDSMDYGEDFEEMKQIAKQYIKGKDDGWGLIDAYKEKARPTDMIEVWIKKEINGVIDDFFLIGRII